MEEIEIEKAVKQDFPVKRMENPMLEIKNVWKQYTADSISHEVLSDISLTVHEGDFLVILGQSGCGKTTLLRLMGGFLPPDSGSILLDGRPVENPSGQMVMVFQSFDQLFPWFTLEKNITYALKKAQKGKTASDRQATASRYLSMTGLSDFKNSYPHTLSGGMKQRGALARALALNPRLLLMDEPFSSLDYLTRNQLQSALKELVLKNHSTVILVTHDIEEAITLGTRIAVLSPGSHGISHCFDHPGHHPHLKEELEEALR